MNVDQSILYVDVENLQDIAKQALVSAITRWPEGFPKPGIIKLYVRADQTELWRIWGTHHLPDTGITVKGVQHYTTDGSKNSADILLALDALTDVFRDRTKHIAILSDDSDYATLFSVLEQEANLPHASEVPFKWFMTDRPNTRSTVLGDFFPFQYVHTVICSAAVAHSSKPVKAVNVEKTSNSEKANKKAPINEMAGNEKDAVARLIIQGIKVGPFKSGDCKKLIAKSFPKNPLAKLDSASFGTQFSKLIWPILEKYGAQLPNPNRKPRKYEMTEEAKKAIT